MEENILALAYDIRRAKKEGKVGIVRRQRGRRQEMVAFARLNSRFYARHYRDLPRVCFGVQLLDADKGSMFRAD